MENELTKLIETNNQIEIQYKQTMNNQMNSVLKFARDNHIPVLLEETAKKLFCVVSKFKPKTILEIGTAIGYSGTLMLGASASSQLTTVENDVNNYTFAKQHFKNQNLSNVKLIFDDAFSAITKLEKLNEKFDFIFLDGPKGQYIKYLPVLKNLLNDGGILFADNVHFKGMVCLEGTIPHRKRTIVVNLRKFLAEINNDSEFEKLELKIGDGIIIAKLNKNKDNIT